MIYDKGRGKREGTEREREEDGDRQCGREGERQNKI